MMYYESDSETDSLLLDRNPNGHLSLTITGRERTGQQEIYRLINKGFRLSGEATACLLSTGERSYNEQHQLVPGQKYHIVIVDAPAIVDNQPSEVIASYAADFRYQIPKAGTIPYLRSMVSDDAMRQVSLAYLTALHAPIAASADTKGYLLGADTRVRRGWSLEAYPSIRDHLWGRHGGFVFLDPNAES